MPAAAWRSALLALAVAAAATLAFAWPLLRRPGLPGGADTAFAVLSAGGFVEALGEGVPYPRWVDAANRGFGAPVFLFYPPLAYYAVAAAGLLAADLFGALRLVLVAAALAAGLSFFAAARERSSPLGAAAGAALYVLLPYHLLDLYTRFALAELVAFVWFPLLFLAVRRLAEGRGGRGAWPLLAAAYAGLLLTHLVTAYMVLFVLVPYALLLVRRTGRWRSLGAMAAAGAAALLCSAVYLVPMLAQRDEVRLEWITDSPFGAWPRNFVYRDEAAHGYAPAPIKPLVNATATRQALLALGAAALLALRLRRAGGEPAAARAEGLVHLALAAWTLLLQTPLSSPLWRFVPELATVQFPWRFAAFQGLSASFLVACALAPAAAAPADASGPPARAAGLLRRRPAVALLLLLAAAAPALVLSARIAAQSPYWMATADAPEVQELVVAEYLPRGLADWQSFASRGDDELPADVELASDGEAEILSWQTHARRLRIDTPEAATLTLRTFALPGWRARVDGAAVPVRAGAAWHTLEIALPAGRHEVEFELAATPDRRAGAALSAGGAVLLALLLLRRPLPAPAPPPP